LSLISFSSFAAAKPNAWVCEIDDALRPWPKADEVLVSLAEPTLTELVYTLQSSGSYTQQKKDLISTTTVSEWGFDKSTCQIKTGFRQGEFVDAFDFYFECEAGRGSFSMDFKEASGSFYEEIFAYGAHRSFSFKNCKAHENN